MAYNSYEYPKQFPLLQDPLQISNGMDHDVIVIKSEDICDNEQSHRGEAIYEDYDDCLNPKYILKKRSEKEEEKLFATNLRQQQPPLTGKTQTVQRQQQRQQKQRNSSQGQKQTPNASQLLHHSQQSDIKTQNIRGSIRVGSIGSLANMMKALQNNNNNTGSKNSLAAANVITNSALSITHNRAS